MQFDGSEKSHLTSTSTNPHPICLWQVKCPREAGYMPVRKTARRNWLILAWKSYQVPCDSCDTAGHLKKEALNPGQWHFCQCFRLNKSCFSVEAGTQETEKHLSLPQSCPAECAGGLKLLEHFGTQLVEVLCHKTGNREYLEITPGKSTTIRYKVSTRIQHPLSEQSVLPQWGNLKLLL